MGSYRFWSIAFAFIILDIFIPLRCWFTCLLSDWHKAAVEEEEAVVIQSNPRSRPDHVHGHVQEFEDYDRATYGQPIVGIPVEQQQQPYVNAQGLQQ